MFCRQCGAQVADNSKFCRGCGAQVGDISKYCRYCGAPLSDNTKFCRGCGNPVDPTLSPEPEQAAPAPVASPAPTEPASVPSMPVEPDVSTPVEPVTSPEPAPVVPQDVAPTPAPAAPAQPVVPVAPPTPAPAKPVQKPNKPAKQPKQTKEKKKGKKGKIIAILISVLLLGTVIFGCLVYFDVLDVPFVDNLFATAGIKETAEEEAAEEKAEEIPHADDSIPDRDYLGTGELGQSYEIPYTSVNEYYKDKATVLSTVPADSSSEAHSESEAYHNLTGRGFTQFEIGSSYLMDGTYTEAVAISSYSDTKHPSYETAYLSTKDELWLITEVNGRVIAVPTVYNSDTSKTPIYVSETSTITAYDCGNNVFCTLEPLSTYAEVVVVETINAETLEQLTLGGN